MSGVVGGLWGPHQDAEKSYMPSTLEARRASMCSASAMSLYSAVTLALGGTRGATARSASLSLRMLTGGHRLGRLTR